MNPEVWLNVFAGDGAAEDVSDMVSRHVGSWDTAEERPPGWDGTAEERPPGWGEVQPGPEERRPPGEPSPYWYQVGPGGLFYWQWAAIAGGAAFVLVLSSSGGRRR